MSSVSYWPTSQNWRRYWPTGVVAAIAIIQLFVSFVIMGLQSAIVAADMLHLCTTVTARHVMGFVCWAFFFSCWISIFCVTCCNRSSVGCATYVLVKNILAFIFSAVLIDFDRKFLDNQWFDYKPDYKSDYSAFGYGSYCWTEGVSGTKGWETSLSLTKGQLAGAVIILVTSLVFVGIYIYVYIRALLLNGRMSTTVSTIQNPHALQQPPVYVTSQLQPTMDPFDPAIARSPNHNILRSRDDIQTVVCNKCGARVIVPHQF